MKLTSKSAVILFSILLNGSCQGFFNFWFVKNAVKEHSEVYEKFSPEWEKSDIKVTRQTYILAVMLNLIRPRTSQPIYDTWYTYTPRTPHLKLYRDTLNKLKARVVVQSVIKALLMGIPLGVLNGYAISKFDDNEKILFSALLATVIIPILSVLQENNSMEKQPYFDEWLKKHDNYFSSLNYRTIKRIALTYFWMALAGALPAFLTWEAKNISKSASW